MLFFLYPINKHSQSTSVYNEFRVSQSRIISFNLLFVIPDVPSNFTTFYKQHATNDKIINKKIKYNNKVLHQSKLINYFNGDYAKSKIEEDLNKFLKKIKKDKKYFLPKIILIIILRRLLQL